MHTLSQAASTVRIGSSLCWVADGEPYTRRIIIHRCVKLGLKAVEFADVTSLLGAEALLLPGTLFVDVEFADGDAIDILRHLKEIEYRGTIHLMSSRENELLGALVDIGRGYGLAMGECLSKPLLRAEVDRLLSAARPQIEHVVEAPALVLAPPVAPVSLGEALDRHDVEVCYQLRFDLRSGHPIGAEAFARRRIGAPGLAPLIPAGSEPADIDRLAEFMLTAVLRDWARFARPWFQPRIALRLPLAALGRIPLQDLLARERPSDAAWPGLVLEISQSDLARCPQRVLETAARLKIHGLKVALDGAGMAKSSIADLCVLMPNELNINPQLVMNCSGSRINAYACQAIVMLGRAINARAIAKEVESEEDLAMLIRIGCEIGQGEYMAPLMSAEDVECFVSRGVPVALPRVKPAEAPNRDTAGGLSERETEVLRLVASGSSSKQAAAQLGLSPRTVESYRAKLMLKLQARNAVELANAARALLSCLLLTAGIAATM